MGVADRYISPENRSPAHIFEYEGIENLAEEKAGGSRYPGKKEDDTFVLEKKQKASVSDKNLSVFGQG